MAKASLQDKLVKDFIHDLSTRPHGDHVVFGMVKPADTDDGFMIAHVGDCENWTYLPASAVKSIQGGEDVRCGGHTHATAVVQLHPPQSDLEKAFAGVAAMHELRVAQLSTSGGASGNCQPTCAPGWHCVDRGNGQYGCDRGPGSR